MAPRQRPDRTPPTAWGIVGGVTRTDEPDVAYAETTASGAGDDATVTSERAETGRAADRLARVDRGRYAIAGELARGGLGRILRARDRHLDRTVALKEMLGRGGEGERRFVREALITARLEHPSIVPVHDAGVADDGAPFYAMKLVGGRPLAEVFAGATTMADRLALVPRILAVADAIAYAHSERVIHRDLKPANVLVGEFGETVVIDWGLAKDLEAGEVDDAAATHRMTASHGDDAQTVDGAVLGTPAYMAPEQAVGAEVDERADVYALGAMLYELLAGAPPHRGKTLDEVLRKVIAGDLEPLARRAPDVPPDLAAIVAKAMARDPGDRYRTAATLAEDLRRYVTGQLVGVYEYGWTERLRRWVSRHRAPVAVGAVAALLLAVLGGFAIQRILHERDQARAARTVAEAREREARTAEQAARVRGDELLIEQARAVVERDPTRALALLAALPADSMRWSAARIVAAQARAEGIGGVLVGHAAATEAVAIDGDGDRIVSIARDGIRVWDLSAKTVRSIALPAPCAGADDCVFGRWDLSLSRDGNLLAASAGAVYVWDLTKPDAKPSTIAGDRGWVLDNGRVVVLDEHARDARKTRVDVVDLATGDRVPAFTGWAEMWIVSPAGVVIAVLPDELRVWRAGEERVAVRAGPVRADAVAVSESGAVIAWAEAGAGSPGMASSPKADTTLWVWHKGEGAPVGYPIRWPRDLTIARDDRAILWHDDDGLQWLALEPAVDLRRDGGEDFDPPYELLAGPSGDVAIERGARGIAVLRSGRGRETLLAEARDWRLGISGDGARLAAAGAAVVRTWPIGPSPVAIATPAFRATAPAAPGKRRPAPRVVTTPELIASADGTTFLIDWTTHPVEVWTRTGGALARTGTLPIPSGADLSISADGKRVLFVDDDGAALMPVAGGAAKRLGDADIGWFGPDGTAYTVTGGTVLRRWGPDGTGGDRICPETDGWTMHVSADGSTVADVSGGAVHRCRLTGAVSDTIAGAGELTAWSLRDDGAAVAGYDRTRGALVAIDASGARHAVPLPAARADVPFDVRISPDGRWMVAVAAEGGFTIADVAAGTARPVAYPGVMLNEVAFAPGDVVVVGAQDALLVADLATGVYRVLPIGRTPGAVAAYGDGAIAATRAGELRIWLDDLPHDPAALRAWILDATNARLGPAGELVMTEPFHAP